MHTRAKDTLRSLLRKSERYTRTDMLYLTSGGFWLTTGRVAAMGSSLALAIAMANLLTPEVFGTYKFVLSGASIIGALALTGMGTAVTQAVARGFEGALRSGARAHLRWGAVTSIAAGAVACYYLYKGNATLFGAFLAVAALQPILSSSLLYASHVAGKRQFKRQAAYDVLQNMIPFAALCAAMVVSKSPAVLVCVYFLSHTVTSVALYAYTVRSLPREQPKDPETIPYGVHLSILGALGKVAENIDKILVFHYLGAAQLAVYTFATVPISHLKILNDVPARLAFPKLSARPFNELQETLPRKILGLMLLMGLVAFAYILISPFVFKIILPAYVLSVPYSQILALSLILVPGTLFNEAITAHMLKKNLYVSRTVLPLIKVGLIVLLLPLYGIWGAIVAAIAAQAIASAFYYYQFMGTSISE